MSESSQQSPYYPPTSPQVPAAPDYSVSPRSQALGITALVIAVIALVLSFVPFFGIPVAIIALVLGIVAIVKKQPKGLSVTATVLAALAVIISLVLSIFTGLVTRSILEELDSQVIATTSVTPSISGEEAANEAASEAGSRSNPVPIGTSFEDNAWQVTLNSVNLDANADVAAANPYNPMPEDGKQWIVVNLSATYKGAQSAYSQDVRVDYVGEDGQVITVSDPSAVPPEPSFYGTEMYAGGSVTGNLALLVPSSFDGVLRVNTGYGEGVFYSLS